jgi:hypothetical protein
MKPGDDKGPVYGSYEIGSTKYTIEHEHGQWVAKINGIARGQSDSPESAVHEALKAMSGHGHHVFGFMLAHQDYLENDLASTLDEVDRYEIEAGIRAKEAKGNKK